MEEAAGVGGGGGGGGGMQQKIRKPHMAKCGETYEKTTAGNPQAKKG